MSKLRVPIDDISFAHANGITVHHDPEFITWVRNGPIDCYTVFLTDRCVGNVMAHNMPKKVALLIEPQAIWDSGYKGALSLLDNFNYVLTYDREFIKNDPKKILFYPIGGCWIPEADQHHDHVKTRMVSIIASDKRLTPAHGLRHDIVAKFQGKNINGFGLEAFGRGYRYVQFKTEALRIYRFSVVVENTIVDDLFTEKLIDCFLTGTIPIYYGTHAIADHFNMAGVLQFRTLEELEAILSTLSEEMYQSLREAIVDNFNRALQYRSPEDWIFKKYPFLFT